jgi:hypothetical protein
MEAGVSTATSKQAGSGQQAGSDAVEGTDRGKYMGLCMNCLHRDTCTFPRPEGGVWRCNEYE